MLKKISKWSCLEIRRQEEVTIKVDNGAFERMEQLKKFGNNPNDSKFYSGRN